MSSKKDINSWDNLIADARAKLAEGKLYAKSMSTALRVLEKNKANGVPLPSGRQRIAS